MNKLCIFDLDGTLIDSLEDLALAGNYLLKKLGYATHPIDAYKQFVGSGIKNLILRSTKGIKWNEQDLEKALTIYMDYYEEHCSQHTMIYPGIIETLDKLIDVGYMLGVVTNKPDKIAKKLVNELFGDRFSYVYGQVPNIPVKPDPTLVLHIIKESKANLSNVYYIGDSDVDIYTAKNASVKSIGCVWGNRGYNELKEAGACFFADNAEDIYNIIMEEDECLL